MKCDWVNGCKTPATINVSNLVHHPKRPIPISRNYCDHHASVLIDHIPGAVVTSLDAQACLTATAHEAPQKPPLSGGDLSL